MHVNKASMLPRNASPQAAVRCRHLSPCMPLLPAVLPLDEIALAIAGLNGPDYASNPTLAYYLSLLRLVALVRRSHMLPLLLLML